MQISQNIARSIVNVSRDVRQLGVDDRNKHGGYDFVSVDKFYAAVGPIMAQHGLATLSDVVSSEIIETDSDDKVRLHLFVQYDIYLIHESGDVHGPIRRDVTVVASGPQSYAAAESFAMKYFLRSTFKIPTGDKDDADLQEKVDLPVKARPPASAKSGVDSAVKMFVEEIRAKLEGGVTPEEFFAWSGEAKNAQRLRKLKSGAFDHVEGATDIVKAINKLYALAAAAGSEVPRENP